jgi:hypothetical protein
MKRLGNLNRLLAHSSVHRIIIFCLIFSASLGIIADDRPVSGPDWQTVNYCNSTTAYGRILLDGGEASINDIVAAFVEGECRGVQYVNLLDDQSYVTLEINGETVEVVEFFIYDVSENLIFDVEFYTYTSPGNSIGYPPDFLPLFATSANANHLPHFNLPEVIEIDSPRTITWLYGIDFYDQDDDLLYLDTSFQENVEISLTEPEWLPVSSSGSTFMFAEVTISGEPAESGDIVSAFVEGECRAVSQVNIWENIPFVSLSVYGASVEPVSFRIHDISSGSTWEADTMVNSLPGGMIGYPDLLDIAGTERIIESDFIISINSLPEQNQIISISLSDFPDVSTVRQDIILDVGSSNQPPAIFLPDVYFNEDEDYQINLDDYTSDPENDVLNYQIVNTSDLLAQLYENMLHLQAPADWSGSGSIQIFAADGRRSYSVDTLFVEVIPVNDPPVLIVPDQLVFAEDMTGHLDLSSSYDIDGDTLQVVFAEQNILDIQPVAPIWQPVTYNNSAYAYLQLSYNEQNLPEGILIAAFVGTECRGRSNTYLFQNNTYAIFPVYCLETAYATFKAYDPVNEMVYCSDSIEINPGSNLGFPPEYYQLEFSRAENPRIFQLIPPANWNGTQTLELSILDSSQASSSGELLIFVSAEPDAPLPDDSVQLNFSTSLEDWLDLNEFIYEPDGDEYSLMIIDNAGLELAVEGSILSILPAPDNVGMYQPVIRIEDFTGLSADMEIEIEILPVSTLERDLVPGWNWFSLPVGSNHLQPEYRLSFLEDSADYLKGQAGFINYQPGVGWIGSLLNISQYSMFQAHLLEAAVLQPAGWLLDADDSPIEIFAGWNWISYIPIQTMGLNEALAPLAGNLDYIKSQNGFAIYYDDIGWIGSLQNFYHGYGYVVHAQYDQVFYYPQPTRTVREDIRTMGTPRIKAADYQYTASITAIIPDYVPQAGDELIAYADDQIAGYASIASNSIFDLRPELGEFYYFLYLYTNQMQPADLQLKLVNIEKGEEKDLSDNISWSPDAHLGDISQPVTLHMSSQSSLNELADDTAAIRVYPNPIKASSNRSQLHISLPQKTRSQSLQARLYNMRGQKIALLDIVQQGDKWVIVSENNWDYPNGVYFFSLKIDGYQYQTKLLILK